MKMAVSIQRYIVSVAGFQAEEAPFSDKIFFEAHQDEKFEESQFSK